MVHLKIADHHEACSVGATSDECSGIDPGVPALFQELPVPKEADEGHHNSTHVANEAEEAALRGVCATLADERNIIQGAAALRAPLFSRVRRAGFIVGPGRWDTGVGGEIGGRSILELFFFQRGNLSDIPRTFLKQKQRR